MDSGETLDVMIYVILTFYVAPAAVFIVGFMLLAGPLRQSPDTRNDIRNTLTTAALSCAVLGVALHNLTDFAIFEPGVAATFWAMMACIASIDAHARQRTPLIRTPARAMKVLAVAAALAASLVYLNYVFVPAAQTTAEIRLANQAISAGRFEPAHELLEQAGKDDLLSAAAWSLNGRLYLHQFQTTQGKDAQLLLRAAECLRTATKRNGVPFKDFERLADAYYALAEVSRQQEKTDWLNKAFDAASLAIERYPGSDRLHFKLAQIAEQLGKTAVAAEQYQEAIRIEDEYRTQFRQMYPERNEVVSRLGEHEYQLAIERVRGLSEKSER